MQVESQSIESATTVLEAQPDSKTRRYDRQLRLWAAAGQSALESARILVLGASATSTSILKNLVLPGIGQFCLTDDALVTPADAGNNFFLEGYESVGKNRATEGARLLSELNDGVEARTDTRSAKDIIADKEFVKAHTVVIAHNLEKPLLDELAAYLWEDIVGPPLIVVRSAGLLAEFFIQFHDHTSQYTTSILLILLTFDLKVIESHLESAPTLRISEPFPSLLSAALDTPFETLDVTDHGHIPFPLILVHALHTWHASHDKQDPKNKAEKDEFKKLIRGMMKKSDEENFEEAESQAWRVWMSSKIPSEISELFDLLPQLAQNPPTPQNAPFYALLATLQQFTQTKEYSGLLPLSGALPDMKADTERYFEPNYL